MKPINKINKVLALMSLGVILGMIATPALADHQSLDPGARVPEGYYRNSDGSLRIFVKTTTTHTGYRNSYGLIFKEAKSSKEQTTAALFVIEPLDAENQLWRQVYQNASKLLSVNVDYETNFMGKFEMKDGKEFLKLTSTPYHDNLCGSETLEAYTQSGRKWDETPSTSVSWVHEKKSDQLIAELFGNTLKLKSGTILAEGNYAPNEILGGLFSFRNFSLDPESASGRSLARPISFLGVIIQLESNPSNYRELRLLGTSTCWNKAVILDERH